MNKFTCFYNYSSFFPCNFPFSKLSHIYTTTQERLGEKPTIFMLVNTSSQHNKKKDNKKFCQVILTVISTDTSVGSDKFFFMFSSSHVHLQSDILV